MPDPSLSGHQQPDTSGKPRAASTDTSDDSLDESTDEDSGDSRDDDSQSSSDDIFSTDFDSTIDLSDNETTNGINLGIAYETNALKEICSDETCQSKHCSVIEMELQECASLRDEEMVDRKYGIDTKPNTNVYRKSNVHFKVTELEFSINIDKLRRSNSSCSKDANKTENWRQYVVDLKKSESFHAPLGLKGNYQYDRFIKNHKISKISFASHNKRDTEADGGVKSSSEVQQEKAERFSVHAVFQSLKSRWWRLVRGKQTTNTLSKLSKFQTPLDVECLRQMQVLGEIGQTISNTSQPTNISERSSKDVWKSERNSEDCKTENEQYIECLSCRKLNELQDRNRDMEKTHTQEETSRTGARKKHSQ